MVIRKKKQKSVSGKARGLETRNKENARGDKREKMKGKIIADEAKEKKSTGGVEVGKGKVKSTEVAKTVAKKHKRGADKEMAEAFFLSSEMLSSRLRPRKDIPSFRRVLLGENDYNMIIGKRIKVFWPDSRKWFAGQIKSFDTEKKLHSIFYDDGDKEHLNLMRERFELQIFPSEEFTILSISEPNPEIPDGHPEQAETVGASSQKLHNVAEPHPGKKEMGSDGSEVSGESTKADATEVNDVKPFEKKGIMKRKKASKAAKKGKSKPKVKRNTKDEKTLQSEDMEVDMLPEKVDKKKTDAKINMERSEDLVYGKDQTGSDSKQASDENMEASEVPSTQTKSLTKEDNPEVLEKRKIESLEAAGDKIESRDNDILEEGREGTVQGSQSPADKQSANDISLANQETASDGGPDPKSSDSQPVSDAQVNTNVQKPVKSCQKDASMDQS